MNLADRFALVQQVVEGLDTAGQHGYRVARTAADLEGAHADRMVILQPVRRVGRIDTGIAPRVMFEAVLVLQLVPGGHDLRADALRLEEESSRLASAIETAGIGVLVGETTYTQGEDEGSAIDLATIELRLVTRRSNG